MGNQPTTTEQTNPLNSQKAIKREEKHKYVRNTFDISETERVIQNYACNCIWQPDAYVNFTYGTMYITQNYVLYEESSIKIMITFADIKEVKEEKHILTWLCIETNAKKYYFTGFYGYHRTEAFTLLNYIWKNPPSYYSVPIEDIPKEPPITSQSGPISTSNSFGLGWENDDDDPKPYPTTNFTRNQGNLPEGNMSVKSPVQVTVQVDTQASKKALAMIIETEQMGIDTLQDLSKQAEQIDRIQNDVEKIHYNLDKSNRLLRGIESLPSYIGNSLLRKKEAKKPLLEPKDRTVVIQKSASPPMDIEILYKKVDCSFQLAILSLGEDGFQCIDPNTNQLTAPEYNYQYSQVSEILLRTRPEHLDIRFHPPLHYKDRFRMMSSYNQIIVNEFYFRLKGNVKIIFEEGSTVFDYGIAKISEQAPIPRKIAQPGFFRRENVGFKTSSIMDGVDQEVKDNLDEVDRDLVQISSVLGNVHDINLAMGKEMDRQNEQMEHVSGRVDEANVRVKTSNLKMDKIIKS